MKSSKANNPNKKTNTKQIAKEQKQTIHTLLIEYKKLSKKSVPEGRRIRRKLRRLR